MRSITDDYKIAITEPRQINAQITTDDLSLDKLNINSINYSFKCDYFKTIGQLVKLDINENMNLKERFNLKFGLKVNDEYEYVDFGNFKVQKSEFNLDTKSFNIVAYDKIIESMIDYDIIIPDNTTIRDVWILIFNRLNWDISVIPNTFINSSKILPSDCWNGLKMSFRDVLDELCTISCVWLLEKNNKIIMQKINETNEIINYYFFNRENVKIKDKVFFNSIYFSRSVDSDSIYRKDENLIEEHGEHKFEVKNLQILNGNNRNDFIDEMFEYIKTLEFYSYDIESTGITYLDRLDLFTANLDNVNYPMILLENEINIDSGLSEKICCNKPVESESDYKYADVTDKSIEQANIIVNKKIAEILLQVAKKVGNDEVIAKLNLAIKEGKGVIEATGNTFILSADNASIDEYGNAEFLNAVLRGGNLDLLDDGTKAGASIKIHSLFNVLSPVTIGTDLSNKILYFNFDEFYGTNLTLPTPESGEVIILSTNDKNLHYPYIEFGIDYDVTITQRQVWYFWYTIRYKDSVLNKQRYCIIFKDADGILLVKKLLQTLEMDEDLGEVTYINNEIDCLEVVNRIFTTNQIEKINSISGYGIETDIIPRKDYSYNDIDYIQDKIDKSISFSDNDIALYDLNNDGYIDDNDIEEIEKFILNGIGSSYPAKFKLNVQTAKDNLLIENHDKTKSVKLDLDGLRFKGQSQGLASIPRLEFEDETGVKIQMDSTGLYRGNIESGVSKILWESSGKYGGEYMDSTQSVELSESILEQDKGIYLIWYGFDPDEMKLINAVCCTQFIPKNDVKLGTTNHIANMSFVNYAYFGTKNIYVTDVNGVTTVSGHNNNISKGTVNGITYDNKRFILKRVIGV